MKWPGNGTLSATCAGGAEPYLEEELRSIGLRPLMRENGVVHFSGGFPEIVMANNLLRTASRILLPLISGSVDGYDDLYRLCRTLDWATVIRPEQSLRVSGVTRSRTIADSSFAAVRIKDAITYSQRAKARKRSSVSRKDPDVGITFFVSDRQAHISLDSSGRPLHERGYRVEAGSAPLRETLAATVLNAAGWNSATLLFDPFCGSGTIAIEAALLAARISPGDLRTGFAFQRWCFAEQPRTSPANESPENDRTEDAPQAPIIASDSDPDAVAIARRNAERAGVSDLITFRVADATAMAPFDTPGLVVTNPPYGERLQSHDIQTLMSAFGRSAKAALPGWRICFLSEGKTGAKSIGLRTRLVAELWNGGIQTNLYGTEIYSPRAGRQTQREGISTVGNQQEEP